MSVFDSRLEVRVIVGNHGYSRNHYRTHSSLANLTRVEFATTLQEEKNTLLASQSADR